MKLSHNRRYGAARAASFLVFSLIAIACDNPVDPPVVVECGVVGSVQAITPENVRQGDVVDLSGTLCRADGTTETLTSGANWSVLDGGGEVDSEGRFVAQGGNPQARVVLRHDEAADTATIRVDPRGIDGAFTTLGLGGVPQHYTSDLWMSGAHGYTATWGAGDVRRRGDRLNVWDVSDPSAPTLTDSIIVDAATVNDVKVSPSGRIIVLTHENSDDGLNGITLLDAADPAHPTVLTRYVDGLSAGVHNVWVEEDYLYVVANGAAGLHTLDIADPANPRRVAHFHAGTSFIHDVYVRDGLAFVSHWDAGLIVLDVGHGVEGGSPSSPREVSRIVTNGGNVHNAWYWPESGYVFIGEEDFGRPGGLHVVDLSNLTEPVEVAEMFLAGDPPHNFWLDEEEGILFASWYGNGLLAIDVTGELLGDLGQQGRVYDRVQPQGPAGTGRIWAPQVHDGVVFASDMDNGLWALDFELISRP